MRLFKFVSSTHAVLNMARGSLKFTPLPELNDPSELTPVMNRAAVRKSLEELRLHGLTKEQYRWLGCQDAVLSSRATGEGYRRPKNARGGEPNALHLGLRQS